MGKAGVKETRPSAVVCNDSAHILIHCSEIESVLVLVNSFSKKKKKVCSAPASNVDVFP